MSDDFGRDVQIVVWQDRTVSFRVKGSRAPFGVNGPRTKQVRHALPVYSVDTIEEAEMIQAVLCVLRYDGSCALTPSALDPDALTGRNLELEDLDRVTDIMRTVHEQQGRRSRT